MDTTLIKASKLTHPTANPTENPIYFTFKTYPAKPERLQITSSSMSLLPLVHPVYCQHGSQKDPVKM